MCTWTEEVERTKEARVPCSNSIPGRYLWELRSALSKLSISLNSRGKPMLRAVESLCHKAGRKQLLWNRWNSPGIGGGLVSSFISVVVDSQSCGWCCTGVGFGLKRSPGIYVNSICIRKSLGRSLLFLWSWALSCSLTLPAVGPHTAIGTISRAAFVDSWF